MLLALDIETTGLDPIHDRVLEIAWTIVNDDFAPTTLGIGRAFPKNHLDVFKLANEYVREMHTNSNLWSEYFADEHYSMHEIETDIMQDIKVGVLDDEPLYLFGSSVHFDRSFLKPLMPALFKRLSHRHVDLTSIKLFMDTLGIERPDKDFVVAHRAVPDVDYELRCAVQYREEILKCLR